MNKYTEKDFMKARDLLHGRVDDFYLFREYFLHMVDSDEVLKDIFYNTAPSEMTPQKVDFLITRYKKQVEEAKEKTDLVASLKDVPAFDFFQYVMTEPNVFTKLEKNQGVKVADIEGKLAKGLLSSEDAMKILNITDEDVDDFTKKMSDDFTMEKD